MEKYRHQNVPVAIICDSVDCDFSNYFVGKNAKDALRQLEAEGKIEVINHLWLFPFQRSIKQVSMDSYFKAIFIANIPHGF